MASLPSAGSDGLGTEGDRRKRKAERSPRPKNPRPRKKGRQSVEGDQVSLAAPNAPADWDRVNAALEVNQQKVAEKEMMDTTSGRAWMFVSAILAAHEAMEARSPSFGVEPVATDDIFFLAERVFKRQEEFQRQGRPTTVDIGYHYTMEPNMELIKKDGLMSRAERDQRMIKAFRNNGSAYGDGIYTANNPFAFHGQHYGSVGLLVARLKGRTSTDEKCTEANTVETKSRNLEIVVLKDSRQCVPLFRFPGSMISKDAGNRQGNKVLYDNHGTLQSILDHFFNGGIHTKVPEMVPDKNDSLFFSGFAFGSGTTLTAGRTQVRLGQTPSKTGPPAVAARTLKKASMHSSGVSHASVRPSPGTAPVSGFLFGASTRPFPATASGPGFSLSASQSVSASAAAPSPAVAPFACFSFGAPAFGNSASKNPNAAASLFPSTASAPKSPLSASRSVSVFAAAPSSAAAAPSATGFSFDAPGSSSSASKDRVVTGPFPATASDRVFSLSASQSVPASAAAPSSAVAPFTCFSFGAPAFGNSASKNPNAAASLFPSTASASKSPLSASISVFAAAPSAAPPANGFSFDASGSTSSASKDRVVTGPFPATASGPVFSFVASQSVPASAAAPSSAIAPYTGFSFGAPAFGNSASKDQSAAIPFPSTAYAYASGSPLEAKRSISAAAPSSAAAPDHGFSFGTSTSVY